MNRLILLFVLPALFSACATPDAGDAQSAESSNDPHGVYSDPTYPGPGVRFGIGIGSWGGHRGGGAGFGLGF